MSDNPTPDVKKTNISVGRFMHALVPPFKKGLPIIPALKGRAGVTLKIAV